MLLTLIVSLCLSFPSALGQFTFSGMSFGSNPMTSFPSFQSSRTSYSNHYSSGPSQFKHFMGGNSPSGMFNGGFGPMSRRTYQSSSQNGPIIQSTQCVDNGRGYRCSDASSPNSFGFDDNIMRPNRPIIPSNSFGFDNNIMRETYDPTRLMTPLSTGGEGFNTNRRKYSSYTNDGGNEVRTDCEDNGDGYRCSQTSPRESTDTDRSWLGIGHNQFNPFSLREQQPPLVPFNINARQRPSYPVAPVDPIAPIAPVSPISPMTSPKDESSEVQANPIDDSGCSSSPCPIDTLCIDEGRKYRCAEISPGSPMKTHGMTGKIPLKVMWQMLGLKKCQPNTCKHGGTCQNNPSEGFRCFCKPGITGKLCEININNCEGSPCQHGSCYDLENDFECDCEPGYTGKRCEIDVDECENNPCDKGAYCTDLVNGYECVTPPMSSSCGKALLKPGVPKIRGGQTVTLGAFPWHAGIYEEKVGGTFECECGGSLVSTNAILTAAHCLTLEDAENSRVTVVKDPKKIRVALGKLHRDLVTKMDPYAQIFTPEKFFIHPDYTGPQGNYGNGIAIIYLKTSVIFSPAVQSVCLDLRNNNENPIPEKAVGMVSGWGRTGNENPSDFLLVGEMPYAPRNDCYQTSALYAYVTKDKICAGDPAKGKTTVCKGDSGGGFVFSNPETRQFFLRGIVSLGAPGCQTDDYALFTDISKHAGLIYKKLFAKVSS